MFLERQKERPIMIEELMEKYEGLERRAEDVRGYL